jgi:hypothetical protein
MTLNTLDTLLPRAISLGLSLVVALGMLGGIDTLAQRPHVELQPQEMATADAAPRG